MFVGRIETIEFEANHTQLGKWWFRYGLSAIASTYSTTGAFRKQ